MSPLLSLTLSLSLDSPLSVPLSLYFSPSLWEDLNCVLLASSLLVSFSNPIGGEDQRVRDILLSHPIGFEKEMEERRREEYTIEIFP